MKSLALAIATLVAVCASGRAEAPPGTYIGTSSTLVKYLNPDTLATVAQETFSKKLTVFIGAPKSASGVTEANPFTLAVGPKQTSAPVTPGKVFLESARVFAISGTPTLYRYWTLQNTATGFTGALTNNYIEVGLAKDRVVAKFGGPAGSAAKFKMHDARVGAGLQCTLDAVVEGNLLKLKARGYAYIPGQAIIHFNTKVNALKQAAPAPSSAPFDE